MSGIDLELLVAQREQILLAEVAGWLHDMGKCSDEMLNQLASDSVSPAQPFRYKRDFIHLLDSSLSTSPIHGETDLLRDLVEKASPRVVTDTNNQWTWLMRALGRCHAAAHIDKEEAENIGKQLLVDTRLSTAFGNETIHLSGLTTRLKALHLNPLAVRADLFNELKAVFSGAPGDTRRPENEVTLWDWSSVVTALFKAAVAGVVLGHQPQPADLRWRLLAVRADRATFVGQSIKLSDIVAREKVLDDAFDRVRTLLEETYPLGAEFYRDADSAVYIVPDIAGLLDNATIGGMSLREVIRASFTDVMSGEVLPELLLDDMGWWAQKPNRRDNTQRDELPPLSEVITSDVISPAHVKTVLNNWQEIVAEPCPVCRLRPTAHHRDTCEVCATRRASRIEYWRNNPSSTIWIDELADANGRVALLVGKFGLEDWLSGQMVSTLLVKDPGDGRDHVPKNASPARLRRVWETCEAFWQDVQDKLLPKCVGEQYRLLLSVDDLDRLPQKTALDGSLDGKPISVWREDQRLFTISNFVPTDKGQSKLSLTWGKDRQHADLTVTNISSLRSEFAAYTPLLPLLQSPDQFMAMLPADRALEAAQAVFDQYVQEFGKVRNRLPLFLGVVFFPRKTPLPAVMDASRRMLDHAAFKPESWSVATNAAGRLAFGNGVEWNVPLKMGDGTTDDAWYPYFNTTHDPGARHRRFVDTKGQHWVHAADLRPRDKVLITPSKYAYTFLDTASDRFRLDLKRDAVLLEELPRLAELWEALKQCKDLTDTELRNVHGLLSSKRATWGNTSDEYRTLVVDTLRLSSLRNAISCDDVLHGRFDRCLDLNLRILKARIGQNHNDAKQEKPA